MATLFSFSLRSGRIHPKIVSVGFVVFCLLTLLATVSPSPAQPPEQGRQIAGRFLEVLLRNPSPGTALDRVYEFHVIDRSLDPLLQSLDVNSGHKQLTRGLIQLKRGDSAAAIESLQRAEALLAGNASASHQLARALAAEGENEQAIKAFRRAIANQPDPRQAPDIYLELGQLHCRTGHPDQAIILWQQLINQFPEAPSVTERVAAALVTQQEFESALEYYQRLAERTMTPETRVGYQIHVADLTARLGQTRQAREQLQAILDRLRPGSWLHADVRDRIERSYLSAGDFDGLADYYQQQAERFPEDIALQVRLAELLVGAGRSKDAETTLLQAIEKAPEHVDARLALVEILEGNGSAAKAAQQIEQLIALDRGNPDYRLRLGEVRLNDPAIDLDGRRAAARDAWNQLATIKPKDAVLLSNIARRMRSIQASDRAIELSRQAIEAAPDDPQYRESLGELLHSLGRIDEAIAAWRSIAAGPRQNASSLVRMADIFASFGRSDLALQSWHQAAELDLSFDQRLRYVRMLSDAKQHETAFSELDSLASLAQSPEERERLLRQRIQSLRLGGKLGQRIAQVSVEAPTTQNQRFLALLFQANDQLGAAWFSIDAALKIDPENVAVLRDAVDIAEGLGRRSEAATHLQTLVRIDKRFQVNHLRRLVQIREQLGEIDQALTAVQDMIDANPASPESYRLYARIAFAAGQHEAGEKMLRRAITVDPRAIDARVTLAKRLAERFETRDAIDHYWQAIEYENRLTAQTQLIQQVVPLYARRGEIEQLITRIERTELNGGNQKSKQILIAFVWGCVKDFNQAHLVLQRMLSRHPRDVAVLQAMVDHLSQSGKLLSAVSYQRRLVNVEDTSANQGRLTTLELEAGLITQAEVMMREMKATKDPKRMASIIRGLAGTDPEQAAELCRVALENAAELWDIKIVWAQLLLLSDASNRAEHVAQAGRVAGEVAALALDHDLASTSGIATVPSPRSVSRLSAIYRSPPTTSNLFSLNRSFSKITPGIPISSPALAAVDHDHFPASAVKSLQTILQLNQRRITSRINSGVKSYSFAFGSNFVAPTDYGEAFWIARCVQILSDRELAALVGKQVTTKQLIDKRFPTPPIDSGDVVALRQAITLHSIQNSLDDTDTLPSEAIIWRVAQLDPAGDHPALSELLARRTRIRQVLEKTQQKKISPLDDFKLAILSKVCQTHQTLATQRSASIDMIMHDLQLRQNLIAECRVAGKEHPFSGVQDQSVIPSSYHRKLAEIQAALWENNVASADRLAATLVQAARASQPGEFVSEEVVAWVLSPNSESEREFVLRHRQVLIDAWIAHCSRWSILFRQRLPPSELFGADSLQIVTPVLLPGETRSRYELFKLQIPFSKRLVDEHLLRGVLPLIPKQIVNGSPRRSLSVADEFLERLVTPLEGATPHELKQRRIIAAFAAWWDQRPLDCLVQLETLADEYPGDIDLQIEAGRLAVVTLHPSKAFERLDRIETHDEQTQHQVELARIILAAKAGKEELVRSTARHLLARPIDAATRVFLMNQLKSIGSDNVAVTSLKQMIAQQPAVRTPIRQAAANDADRIALAKSLLQSGDFITASEVAYSVINGRQDARESDRSSSRRQAIDILVQTNRLQPLITATERKYKSSPNSDAYRQELADLYVAAGQSELASRLWRELIDAQKLTPRQIIIRAGAFRGRREFHHAAIWYLYAFERDPDQWGSHWNAFTDAASMSTSQQILFDHLCRIDIRSFSPESLCGVLRSPGSRTFGEAQRRFARHVILNGPPLASHLDMLLAAIPAAERKHIPELTAMLIDVITSENAFRHDSPLWTIRRWNDSGAVQGVLAEMMNLLHNDDLAASRFLSAVNRDNAENAEPTRPIRELLNAVYELHVGATRKAAAERLAAMFPANFDRGPMATPTGIYPAGLLWQTGQLIGTLDQIDRNVMLQIGIFQAAARISAADPIARNSVASPTDQLYRAYAAAGRSGLARRGWLERLRTRDDPRTTGVSGNRQMQVAARTAKNLTAVGFPVDAAGICRRFLDKPQVFRLAGPYSQGRNHRRILETQFESAINAIDAETAIAYVNQLNADLHSDGQRVTVDLYATTLEVLTETPLDCLLELAVRTASSTPAGRESCRTLLGQLDSMADPDGRLSPHLPVRLILASVTQPAVLGDLLDECERALDAGASLEPGRLRQYAMAMSAIGRSKVKSADKAVERVLTRLRQIATEANNQSALLVLTGLSRRPEAMHAVLDSLADGLDEGPQTLKAVDRCLDLATRAAETQQWDLVARALRMALGEGPPVVPETSTTNVVDPFGGEVQMRRVAFGDDPLADMRERVLSLLGNLCDSRGVPITSPTCDVESLELNEEYRNALDDSLCKLVFPGETLVNVYAYKRPVLVGEVNAIQNLVQIPGAVSYAIGQFARARGTTESLIGRIGKRSSASAAPDISALYVDLALTCGDRNALSQALDRFKTSMDRRLPLIDAEPTDGQPRTKPHPPRDAPAILALSDQVFRTLWPVIKQSELPTPIKEQAKQLLTRTAKLMRGNQDVLQRHKALIQKIETGTD